MSAHNPATLEYARRRTQFVIDHFTRNEPAQLWAGRLQHLTEVGSTAGSLRQWMAAHAGADVETLQLILSLAGADAVGIRQAWAPRPRTVDTSHASYVLLGGSRRDYAGAVTYLSEPTVGWLGFSAEGLTEGRDVTLICYYAA